MCSSDIGRRKGVVRYLAELTESQSLVEGWLPLVGTIFLFILGCNWIGALVPWSLLELPPSSGELSAPTNDINLTACLALITSHATFYTGFSEFGWVYPMKYFRPVAYLVPLNLLEEFSKPLSLSFRLLGNTWPTSLLWAYSTVSCRLPSRSQSSCWVCSRVVSRP